MITPEPEMNEAAGIALPTASMNPMNKVSAMNMIANHGDFNGIVITTHEGQLVTSSLGAAEKFEKRHADVLRAIEGLECSADFRERNFAFSTYRPDGQRRDYPYVEMTRDGFTFLVMGFTGKEAAAWKEKYIAAFNAMEAQLRSVGLIDLSDPSQLLPLLTGYTRRTQIAEAKVAALEPKAEAFDRLDTAEGNLTVRPASKVLGIAEHKLINWLQVNGWAFRQNGKGPLQAYVDKRNAGYLDHKMGRYQDQSTGEDKVSITLVITPKGMARIAKLIGGAQ